MNEYFTPVPGFNRFNNAYKVHRSIESFFKSLETIEPSQVFATPFTFGPKELPAMSFVDDKPTFDEYLQVISDPTMPGNRSWLDQERKFWTGYHRLKKWIKYPIHIYQPPKPILPEELDVLLKLQIEKMAKDVSADQKSKTDFSYGAAVIDELTNQRIQLFLPVDSEKEDCSLSLVQNAGKDWFKAVTNYLVSNASAKEGSEQPQLNRYLYNETEEEILEFVAGIIRFRTYQFTDSVESIIIYLIESHNRLPITNYKVDMPPNPGV